MVGRMMENMDKNVLKIYPNTIIYILCPANLHTGGPTLLHQLGSQLLVRGLKVKMVYLPADGKQYINPVEKEYEKYHLEWTQEICDEPQNILVVNETFTTGLYWGEKIQKVLWWLSVDNYFVAIRMYYNNLSLNKITTKPLHRLFSFDKKDRVIHWCQSEYARQFVICNGVPEADVFMVEDYLSQGFLACTPDLSVKKNMVAFNPRKGWDITKNIIEARPDIDWRPIANMTPVQVKELLLQAKVYIDFGNHPGKDRIPREAALSGCVVITGRQGAAANDIDIQIPADFKINDADTNAILAKIDAVFADYMSNYQRQSSYRLDICDDFNRFNDELDNVLEVYRNKTPIWSAVVNDRSSDGIEIAKALLELRDEYMLRYIVDDELIEHGQLNKEHNLSYMQLGKNKVEVVTCADADFLYREGRIKKIFISSKEKYFDTLRKQLPCVREEDILLV